MSAETCGTAPVVNGVSLCGHVAPNVALAEALNGTLIGHSSVQVGDRFIDFGVTGVVRVGAHVIGSVSDGTDALVAGFQAVIA